MRLALAVSAAALVLSAAAAPALATNCATISACVLGENSSAGASSDIGVEGTSTHGFGLVGVTSAAPATDAGRVAGLYGKDQGSTAYNSGVSAFSQNGTGLIAFGVNGFGVEGLTTAATGGYAAAGVGGQDTGTNNENVGTYGQSNVGAGVFGYSPQNGDGVDAEADGAGAGIYAIGGAGGYPAVDLVTAGSGDILDLYNGTSTTAAPSPVASFDGSGNLTIAGSLTVNTTPTFRTRGTGGTDVASYGARTASPTLEDFGQGVIRGGAGHVALDPTFASTIDTRSYLVFITPHGDSHSLYTTLTANGFDVHESELGRSTLAFDYRIVGRPLDTQVAHMPATSTLPQFAALRVHKMRAPIHRARVLSKTIARTAF